MKLCPKCKAMITADKQYCDDCAVKVAQYRAERNKQTKKEKDKLYNKFKRDKRSDKFYHSKPWKRLRDYKIAESGYLCEECKKNGKVTPAADVHHIIPIKEDWDKRFDLSNLVCLCVSCHNQVHGRGYGKKYEPYERHRCGRD